MAVIRSNRPKNESRRTSEPEITRGRNDCDDFVSSLSGPSESRCPNITDTCGINVAAAAVLVSKCLNRFHKNANVRT